MRILFPHRTKIITPQKVIIVEGIFIFADAALRSLFDIKLFVDTDIDIRFIRRLKRDIKERGRTLDSVISQYLTTVRPMHSKFVEPTKKYANVVIDGNKERDGTFKLLIRKLKSLLVRK